MNDLLGKRATDRITGFSGTITGFVTYISGLSQVLLTPPIAPDGALRGAEWFDEQRIVVLADEPIVPDYRITPAVIKEAPKR